MLLIWSFGTENRVVFLLINKNWDLNLKLSQNKYINLLFIYQNIS
jgi:hypothetical protein